MELDEIRNEGYNVNEDEIRRILDENDFVEEDDNQYVAIEKTTGAKRSWAFIKSSVNVCSCAGASASRSHKGYTRTQIAEMKKTCEDCNDGNVDYTVAFGVK
jgi:hypothetical protein